MRREYFILVRISIISSIIDRTRKLLILFICLVFIQVNAQFEPTNVISKEYEAGLIPDNPNVSSLGEFGFKSIDKYTGTANISIPLYNLSLDGLNIPLSLSYNTGGVKVAQESSWVGLGWNLSSGAFITNEINGFEDTKPIPTLGGDSPGFIYTKSYLTRNHPDYELEITESDVFELTSSQKTGIPKDVEPDIFTVNLFGRKIKFVLKKLENNQTVINLNAVGSPNIKISFDSISGEFIIVDEHGFSFYFENIEYSTPYSFGIGSYSSSYTEEDLIRQVTGPPWSIHDIEQDRISWQISKIISPNFKELNFSYERVLSISYPSITDQVSLRTNEVLNGSQGLYGPYIKTFDKNPDHTSRYYVFESLMLNNISGDFGSINFVLNDRLDLFNLNSFQNFTSGIFTLKATPLSTHSAKKLSSIIIKDYNGNEVKEITLNHSYFNDNYINSGNKEEFLRLKLDSVSIENESYSFSYIDPNSLPSKKSKDTDFWGYYNGANNTGRIPKYGRFNASYGVSSYFGYEFYLNYERGNTTRKSNFDYGKIGLLNKITYPTKGTTEYYFEPNEVTVNKPEVYTPSFDVNDNFKTSNVINSEDYEWNYQYLKMANSSNYTFVNNRIGCNTNNFIINTNGEEFTIENNILCNNQTYNITINATLACATGCGPVNAYGPATWIKNTDTNQTIPVFSFSQYSYSSQGWSTNLTTNLTLPPGNYRLEYNQSWSNPSPLAVVTNDSYLTLYKSNIVNPDDNASPYEIFEVGGARINKILNKDNLGGTLSLKTFEYEELKTDNKIASSGVLMNTLLFHSKNNGFFEYTPEGYYNNTINISSNNMLRMRNSASGHHVGYTRVTEIDRSLEDFNQKKGKLVTKFVNYPNEYITRYVGNVPAFTDFPGNTFYGNTYINGVLPKSYDYKNGSVLTEEVYDENDLDDPKQIQIFEYSEENTEAYINDHYPHISYQSAFYCASNLSICGSAPYIPYYYPVGISSLGLVEHHFYLRKKTTNILFYDTGNNQNITEYFYESGNNSSTTSHYQPTRIISENSKGQQFTVKNYYPLDLTSEPHLDDLISANRISNVILSELYVSDDLSIGELNSTTKLIFGDDTNPNNLVLPKITAKSKATDIIEDEVVYHKYDDIGNLIEYSKSDGAHIFHIWGYNKQYLIAKIENFTSDQALSIQSIIDNAINKSNADDDQSIDNSGNEGLLRQALNNLRNHSALSNSMVTTFTYDPLIGVTSITDPKGYTIYYEYDSLNRLKQVKDAEGNILSENEYNYRPQTNN